MMKLEYFATDEFKSDFLIFMIDRGDDLDAFLWVKPDGSVRMTDIYGLTSYCNHAMSPLYVKEDLPEEMIDKAYEALAKLSEEDRKKLLEKFNERDERMQEDEEDYKERNEYEEEWLRAVKDARKGDGFLLFM